MKKSMKKTNTYKILTLSLLSFCLYFMTGCTIPFLSSAPSNITLVYESLWEKSGTYEDVFANYKKTNSYANIDFQDRTATDITAYKADLLDRLKNNRDVPDVIRVHVSWLPEFKDYLAPAPSELFSKESIDTNYYPSVSSLVVYKDASSNFYIYGVPLYYDQLNLVYNKAHFNEAGYKAAPVTWEQFFRYSYFLTKKDASNQVIRSGAAFGDKNIEFYTDIFGLLLGNANLEFPKSISTPSDSLESVVRVLNRSTDWNPSFQNSGNALVSGRASMAILPAWRVDDLLRANKDLSLGVAPVPSSRQDRPMNWPSFFVEAVPANSKNPSESWKLIKHMSSEESAKSIYSKQASTRRLPSLPALKNLSTTLNIDPLLKDIALDAANSTSGIGAGYSFVMSDRSGNTPCVDSLKKVLGQNQLNLIIESYASITQSCGLKDQK
jgi:ABC-type glycerol-3-phosphate transport system substrate-binding protein